MRNTTGSVPEARLTPDKGDKKVHPFARGTRARRF